MMVVGFLGCCGAIKESPCMLGLVSHRVRGTETSCLHRDNELLFGAVRHLEALISEKHQNLLFSSSVLPLPAHHLRRGGGCWDLGLLQQRPGTHTQHTHTHTHTDTHTHTRSDLIVAGESVILLVVSVSQVVEDVTEFYKQTYSNYGQTKQEALKETLRLIHFGVRTNLLTSYSHLETALTRVCVRNPHVTWPEVFSLVSWSQLNCCGPTGTVMNAARDTCPDKEGLVVTVTPHKDAFKLFTVEEEDQSVSKMVSVLWVRN